MRMTRHLPLFLLANCLPAAAAPSVQAEPAARVVFGDLALEKPLGRAALRARVATAVRDFCRRHEDDIMPQALQRDSFQCLEQVRSALVADMPRGVREAYRRALREAGARGRRL
jgi:UrcA family protein